MADDPNVGFIPHPPRDNIVRFVPGIELRSDTPGDGLIGTLVGHMATYGEWTEIRSAVEGHFMERMASGAFTKTFADNRDRMRVVYDHGQDSRAGRMPLGPLQSVTDTGSGIDYTAGLLDTAFNRDLLPGLRAGLYGSSYRFSATKDTWNVKPGSSEGNPEGLPERTVQEAKIVEFGPTPFPAYASTTAGIRSMTDDYLRRALEPDGAEVEPHSAEPVTGAEVEPHSEPEAPPDEPAPTESPDPPEGGSSDSRSEPVPDPIRREDRPARMTEIRSRLETIATENSGVLPAALQSEEDTIRAELLSLEADQKADDNRRAFIGERATQPPSVVPAYVPPLFNVHPTERVRNIYSFAEIRAAANGPEEESQLMRDTALRVVEAASFPQMDRAIGQGRVKHLLDDVDDPESRAIAKRVIATGNPAYRRAMRKTLVGQSYAMSDEEQRAMSVGTTTAGGFAITFDLDPTFVQTSTGAIVPYRRAARVVNITTDEWRGVTSGGVVAAYGTEAATATDNSPTLAQPAAITQKAQCYVPFSLEIQGDYPGLEAELAREIQDAKDVLEAVQFTTGAGTTVFPQGIVTGSTNASTFATTGVLAASDLYNVETALAPRFRTNARWFANRMFYNKIRAIDTAGGAQLWTQNLTVGLDSNREGNTGMRLLGYAAEECSGFTATFTGAGNKVAVFGDASYFVIVDRIGLNLELVPLEVTGTPGTPTGRRGLYAWWRNTSKVLSASAFLTATTA